MNILSSPSSGSDLTPSITCVPVGFLAANCYLVACPQTGDALVIDPGAEPDRIIESIQTTGCHITMIVHTHGHFDHISATEAILASFSQTVPLAAHADDAPYYQREARAMGLRYGYAVPDLLAIPDQQMSDGDEIQIGNLRMNVIHTPGHTPGSISLLCGSSCIFTGDTLFRHGIGRTDLAGGDEEAIYASILTRLYPLAEALTVFAGHGPQTTIGEERHANPFVQAR